MNDPELDTGPTETSADADLGLPPDPRLFVLHGLGLDGEFLDLALEERAEALSDVEGAHLRRHLGRAFLYTLLVLAFVTALSQFALIVGCGLVAILAGKDLAKFVHRRRLLAAARSLFLDPGADA